MNKKSAVEDKHKHKQKEGRNRLQNGTVCNVTISNSTSDNDLQHTPIQAQKTQFLGLQ